MKNVTLKLYCIVKNRTKYIFIFDQSQAGDEIRPESAQRVEGMAPTGTEGLYHPVDFCIPVGPIFNFVSGI